jgi:hypothetical protein
MPVLFLADCRSTSGNFRLSFWKIPGPLLGTSGFSSGRFRVHFWEIPGSLPGNSGFGSWKFRVSFREIPGQLFARRLIEREWGMRDRGILGLDLFGVVDEAEELPRAYGMLELPHRFGLNLPDTFPSNRKDLANLF